MTRAGERGAGKLKTIISLLILGLFVYASFKVTPAYVNNFQLLDAMKTEARFAAVNRRSPEEVRDNIYKKIKELEIPADRDDIRVEVLSGNNMRITVTYRVTVDLLGYQFTLPRFAPTADNMSL